MSRYHPILVTLHWLLAVLIIGGLFMGSNLLAQTPNSDPFKLIALKMHMSIGIVILVLMAIRLAVRLVTQRPAHADIGNNLINRAAIWGHWGFYAGVFAMCVSGLAIANIAGLPAIVFGGSGAPLPVNFDNIAPRAAHGIIAKVLILLVVGHVFAALYHQYIRKDRLFARMWFGNRNGGDDA
ncbi:MAG: cytochrome b/b6 domain-containing protein [Marinosulfonomonas sp.]|nr:cytochrome b/b6 domain-containing protein [Marinosulfonomonas sp.]